MPDRTVTQLLRLEAETVWQCILEHPFPRDSFRGTMPADNFTYYLLQDYGYLTDLIRAMARAAASIESFPLQQKALSFVQSEARNEIAGYEQLLKIWNIPLEKARQTRANPTTLAYRQHLLAISAWRPAAELFTAVLPCYWTYQSLARRYVDCMWSSPDKRFGAWSSFYISREYENLLSELKALVEELAAGSSIDNLRTVFLTSSRYELMFWDAVQNQETWPV